MACSSQVLIVSAFFRLVPLTGYPKPVLPQGEREIETFGLEGGIGSKGKLGARGVANKQGRGWGERKAGNDTHQDPGTNKERKENVKEGWGKRYGKLGKRVCKSEGKWKAMRENVH